MQLKARAKIDNWQLRAQPGGEDPDRMVMLGVVTNAYGDDMGISITSPVIWYSFLFRVAETQNTFYELGEPNKEWVNELGTIGRTIESFEPVIQ